MPKLLSRRDLLRYAGLAGAASLIAACKPQVVEVEKIVKETVEVEKVVKETVVVEKEVEKAVKETVVVEKEVEKVVEKTVVVEKEGHGSACPG